ncbi:hypothetical protein DMN91_006645 [Ooceraea biroi]|uniref:Uncharacterized protein n=1 Tax=Ooceraea biroi TaxID=2015173 RepID=A0A3L8DJC1_OOCBI|nr:hypothetical protein DMN91_006645 [Ooceraea biroi]
MLELQYSHADTALENSLGASGIDWRRECAVRQRRKEKKEENRKQSKTETVMISKDTSVKQGASIQKYKDKGMKKNRKVHQSVCQIRMLE